MKEVFVISYTKFVSDEMPDFSVNDIYFDSLEEAQEYIESKKDYYFEELVKYTFNRFGKAYLAILKASCKQEFKKITYTTFLFHLKEWISEEQQDRIISGLKIHI